MSRAARSSMYIFSGLVLRSVFNLPCFVVTSGCRWTRPSALCLRISSLNRPLIFSTIGSTFVNNGCSLNSPANGRCSKSFTKHSAMKSVSCGEYISGFFNEGGGFLGIWKSARMGCNSDRGGSPSANSIAVMPIDQTSQRESYEESNCCSQAITCFATRLKDTNTYTGWHFKIMTEYFEIIWDITHPRFAHLTQRK